MHHAKTSENKGNLPHACNKSKAHQRDRLHLCCLNKKKKVPRIYKEEWSPIEGGCTKWLPSGENRPFWRQGTKRMQKVVHYWMGFEWVGENGTEFTPWTELTFSDCVELLLVLFFINSRIESWRISSSYAAWQILGLVKKFQEQFKPKRKSAFCSIYPYVSQSNRDKTKRPDRWRSPATTGDVWVDESCVEVESNTVPSSARDELGK